MLSVRQLLLALVLSVVGVYAWWIQTEEEIARKSARPAERRPDYTVDRLSVTTMGETGRPDRRLVAREVRHYPDDGGHELEEPRLTLFKEGEPPWFVRSDQGRITEDGDELLLQGPVLIDREAGADTRPVHIKTWELYVQTQDEYARTERPVHVTSGADWLSSASGAEVWFGDPMRLNLFGRVRLQLDPP